MDDFINLIHDEFSYKAILTGILIIFGFLWKHYEKILKVFLKQNSKNSDMLSELRDVVQSTKFIETTIEEGISDLNSKIENLEGRLYSLEKTLIETKTTDKEILKDVENIRKSIEILQIIKSIGSK